MCDGHKGACITRTQRTSLVIHMITQSRRIFIISQSNSLLILQIGQSTFSDVTPLNKMEK